VSPPTATLLVRLTGPMQSWGTDSFSSRRDTGREPSFSGVIGLVCAALGRGRSASIEDLTGLRMAARADREGVLDCDFQTAREVYQADGRIKPVEVIRRYFLADADFLVGLQGDKHLLRLIHDALRQPRWFLYLGRRSYVPGEAVWLPDGLRPGEDLLAAVGAYPWRRRWPAEQPPERLRMVVGDPDGDKVRYDVPVGTIGSRRFMPRRVRTLWVEPNVEGGGEDVPVAPGS
jgi:CRISPR system Cascade subunit CasD